MQNDYQPRSHASAAILPLPADVISQIESSTTITSLISVVLGLLENSLDAQASRVNITVDFGRGGCSVEDDGLGILPSEFHENGGVGRMHCTSKHGGNATSESHGGQGTFLASLAALSLLTVMSRHCQHSSLNTLTLHRSKVIARLVPAPPQQAIHGLPSHGTRVTVRDLFGNMPVRVKQRAMVAEESAESEKNWHSLKKGISALLIAWRSPVNVRITDAETGQRGFNLNPVQNLPSSVLTESNVNAIGQRSPSLDAGRVLSTFVKAGYTTFEAKDRWIPAFASTLTISLRGLISLEPAPNKTAQFISIGISPCTDESGHNELYDAVNRVFSQSSFGQLEDDSEPDEAEVKRRNNDRRYKRDGFTNKKLNGRKKGVDRWPRFYLQFEIKQGSGRRAIERPDEPYLKGMVDVLEALVTQWLDTNHFRPRKRRQKRITVERSKDSPQRDSSTSSTMPLSRPRNRGEGCSDIADPTLYPLPESRPRTANQPSLSIERKRGRRKSDQTDSIYLSNSPVPQSKPFAEWSRIKSSRSSLYDDIWKGSCAFPKPPLPSRVALDRQGDGQRLSESAIRVESVHSAQSVSRHMTGTTCHEGAGSSAETESLGRVKSDEVIEWTDPSTKKKLLINSRTGVVLPGQPLRPSSDTSLARQSAAMNIYLSAFGKPLSLERRRSTPTSNNAESSKWLESFLRDWKNPVFANRVEQAIPVAAFNGPGLEIGEVEHRCKHREMQETFLQVGHGTASRLSKAALFHAQVISQVDQKFILLKMSGPLQTVTDDQNLERPILVLVDQHAASERCILEKLFNELCTVPLLQDMGTKSNLGHSSLVQTRKLEKPIHFQVSSTEGTMFKGQAAHFARWGILYDLERTNSTSSSTNNHDTRLTILTLPPGIAERCKAEPKLLIELLRTEIYAVEDSPYATARRNDEPSSPTNQHSWLRQLGSCPESIINLLNSRACRSAVMFNDKLSLQECEELVRQLAKCAFPFMCAHGRVSMVPLVYLGDQEEGQTIGGLGACASSALFDAESLKPQEGFASAYKRWRGRRS